jgi:ankyrin repeat protein
MELLLAECAAGMVDHVEHASTPLGIAVEVRNLGLVRLLLAAGASATLANSKGCTPLMLAQDLPIARALVDARADATINAADAYSVTALSRAVQASNAAMVELLLSHGADPCAQDDSELSVLGYACMLGAADIVELLLMHGADGSVDQLAPASPLMMAALAADPRSVRLLLAARADTNLTAGRGLTALMAACRTAPGAASSAVVTQLLAAGARVGTRDAHGDAALHFAVRMHNFAVARLLLEAGADPLVLGKSGTSVLMCGDGSAAAAATDADAAALFESILENLSNKRV